MSGVHRTDYGVPAHAHNRMHDEQKAHNNQVQMKLVTFPSNLKWKVDWNKKNNNKKIEEEAKCALCKVCSESEKATT